MLVCVRIMFSHFLFESSVSFSIVMDAFPEIIPIDDQSSVPGNINKALDNEPVNITGTNFHHLNDHVLLKIMSMDALSLLDSCSLAETSKRLKRLAQSVFPAEFGIRALKHKLQFESEDRYFIDGSEDDAKRILKNFGSRLSMLSIKRNDGLLQMAAEYCGGSLSKMEFIKMKNGLEPKFEPIFRRLQNLRIIDCEFVNCTASPAVINFDSLTELEVICSTGCIEILRHNFPNLESFNNVNSTIGAGENGDAENFNDFFGRHPTIIDLDIDTDENGSDMLQGIGKYCVNLESLGFQSSGSGSASDFTGLQNLTKLTQLRINPQGDISELYISMLREMKSLETVTIMCKNITAEVLDALSELPNLVEFRLVAVSFDLSAHIEKWEALRQIRKLELSPFQIRVSKDHLSDIVRQLPNLEEFKFQDAFRAFRLAKEDYEEIVHLVEGRPNVLALKCRFDFDDGCVNQRKVKLIKY